jgi:hypothetical protein
MALTFPALADLAPDTSGIGALSGIMVKAVLVASDGSRWLVKWGTPADGDMAYARGADALGIPYIPASGGLDEHGMPYVIMPYIDGLTDMAHHGAPLTMAQTFDCHGASIIDVLVADWDRHNGNIAILPDGRLVSIDHTFAPLARYAAPDSLLAGMPSVRLCRHVPTWADDFRLMRNASRIVLDDVCAAIADGDAVFMIALVARVTALLAF